MLACDYNKHSSYITFPCYVQPKLDGVRAIFYKNKLFSRNGNTFPNLEHIKTELKSVDLVLDGELYTKEVKFEELVGLVKRQSLSDEQAINCLNIKYFVYDYISNTENNKTRISKLTNFFKENKFNYIEFVITEVCNRKEDVQSFHDKFVKFGYEGVMLRNFIGLYAVNSRSKDLQKYKMFLDDEFKIVDYTCGSGKEEGCVIWICKTESGKQFNARPEGNYSQRKELYKNARKFIGKMLTVRYQNLTQDGIPRFPVGITIRDYE
jgi:DNA ligase-1